VVPFVTGVLAYDWSGRDVRPEDLAATCRGFRRTAAVGVALCFLGVCHPAAAQRKAEGGLVFEVLPTSQKIAVGKPIRLTFRVRNVGTRRALANRRFYLHHQVSLEITAASGQAVRWCGRLGEPLVGQSDFVILAPGAQVERAVQISCDDRRKEGYAVSAAGEYVVRARYELGLPLQDLKAFAQGAFVMRGSIEAPPVQIEIRSAEQEHDVR
jgi:hypothetical protein